MMDISNLYIALANLMLCLCAIGMCLCRLNSMDASVLFRERAKYVISLCAALASGTQPWYGEVPGWASLAMSFSLTYALYIGAPRWRRGVPSYVRQTAQE